MSQFFEDSLAKLRKEHDALIRRKNTKTSSNGVWTRYAYPVVTAGHTPLFWRYDLNPATNPRLLERFGINSAFNSGAIKGWAASIFLSCGWREAAEILLRSGRE